MSIELTTQQQELIDRQGERPPRVGDPRTNSAYVLIPEADYARLREVLADEEAQKEIRKVGWQNAVKRVAGVESSTPR